MLKPCFHANIVEAGCDEAGRGCLAGPVVAAAVVLPQGYKNELLDDSKKLSEKKRLLLKETIEAEAESFAVAFVDPEEIDRINIFKASMKAMHLALEKLPVCPEHILVDGNKFFPFRDVPHQCVVKGDGKYMSIAAASVLAKTYRDTYMLEMCKKFPVYSWENNKGYPTKAHRMAIAEFGVSPIHRSSFKLLDDQLEFDFPLA